MLRTLPTPGPSPYFWMLDRAGRLVYLDDRFVDFLGIGLDQLGDSDAYAALHHPDEHVRNVAELDEAIARGRPFRSEHRLRRRDGAYRWFVNEAAPVRGEDGAVTRWLGVSIDVDDGRRSEAALRDSQATYGAVLDSIDDGFCVCELLVDDAGRPVDYLFLDVNPAFERHTGLRHAAGRTALELVPTLERYWIDNYAGVALARRPMRFVQGSDVMGRWFDVSAFPLGAASSRRFGVLFTDITARRHAEEAARESDRRVRLVSDNIPALVAYVDREVTYRFVNARYQEWFGVPPEAIVGRHIRDVLGEDIYEQREPYVVRALAGETVHHEGPTVHCKLGARDTDVTYVPDRDADGHVRGFFVMVFDVTDRNGVEAALRATQRLNEDVLDSLAAHIAVVDEGGTITMVNASWRRFALENGAEWTLNGVGVGVNYLDVCSRATGEGASDATAIHRGLSSILAGTSDYFSFEYPCHSPTVERWYLLTASPLSHGGGAVIAHQNITQRRKAEETLRAADRRKDEFLATLAHELRNPLAPLRNGLEILRLAAGRPALMEDARAMMERQLGQMVHLIDDLLDLGRVRQGKVVLRNERVSLADVLRRAIETSRPVIDEARHVLAVDLPEGPLVVDADRTRLTQVFANLLNNAAKFTPRGGRIEIRVHRDREDALVRVRDSGVGIDPSMLSSVFEMFVQGDLSAEGERSGLGIGLSLVKGLVMLHGGSVEARSDGRGKGSEFVVRLPLAGNAPVEEAGGQQAVPAAARRRILVVDDNRDAAASLAIMLQASGEDARSAYDAVEALAVGESFRPEAVILDLGMPRVSGFEAARRIRREAWGKDVKLIALTGWGQEADRRRTEAAGFVAHLVKPADPADIARVLATAVPRTSPKERA